MSCYRISGSRAHFSQGGTLMKALKQPTMWLFFGLAYLFTWFFWGTQVAEAQGLINFHFTGQVIDQAALHGLLKKVWDLGMPLVSVNRIEPGQPAAAQPAAT